MGMNWKRAILYGVAVWAIPFVASFAIFPLRESNRPLFESLIGVIVVVVAVAAALRYFRRDERADLAGGAALGFCWAAISVIIDLPVFTLAFGTPLPDYLADVALTYLAFPAITTGIALAGSRPAARR